MMIKNLVVHEFKPYGDTLYRVYVSPGETVEIHTHRNDALVHVTTFRVGDPAEYDSFNLKYIGEIKSISPKTITIQPRADRRSRRLKLETFAWRNANFDLERITQENRETMNYI